jgi:hypothetical protein
MKKTLSMVSLLLFLVTVPAFAATLDPADSVDKAPAGVIIQVANSIQDIDEFTKLSKGVYAGAETNTVGYALVTAHTSGTKFYGTASDATALYVRNPPGDAVVGSQLSAPTSSSAAEAFDADTAWTKL